MSIWGKLLGGGIGYILGGPIGALVGGVAGHAVDMAKREKENVALGLNADRPEATREIAFTMGVIVLSAKMAKADGRVSDSEIEAFREVFHIPDTEMKHVGRLFNTAKQDADGYEPYARQIAELFRDKPEVLEDLIAGLMHIARADHIIHEAEVAFLKSVADIFGLSEQDYRRLHETYLGEEKADPFVVLGVDHDADDAEIKSVYRDLIRKNHPDRAIAQGLPDEFVEIANEKLAKINAAYEDIRRIRSR